MSLLERIKTNKIISDYEEIIGNPILDYLTSRKDLKFIGKKKIDKKDRAPTISFFSKERTSKTISEILVSNKIATRNDNFYAWRCLKSLGINLDDGVVRLSLTHYNSEDDVKKLISILKKI